VLKSRAGLHVLPTEAVDADGEPKRDRDRDR
jgi:hypothetical protein